MVQKMEIRVVARGWIWIYPYLIKTTELLEILLPAMSGGANSFGHVGTPTVVPCHKNTSPPKQTGCTVKHLRRRVVFEIMKVFCLGSPCLGLGSLELCDAWSCGEVGGAGSPASSPYHSRRRVRADAVGRLCVVMEISLFVDTRSNI